MTLDSIIPWGRSFEEYVAMFNLSQTDLSHPILGCGDGPASFNQTMTKKGHHVTSCDPLYTFSKDEIQQRINDVFEEVLAQLLENRDDYVWTSISSPEMLGALRLFTMKAFLKDYDDGKHSNRYVTAELPTLPFDRNEFKLALCSHFLFLYQDHLSLEFHQESLLELCRVAKEVRIFPLLTLAGVRCDYIEPVMNALQKQGYQVVVEKTEYEFQRGGNEMMRIKKPT
jgi:hypothetical protein